MKKIYLILFLLTLAIGIYAQSGTYTANGVEWKYELNGTEATITGDTAGGNVFNKALNIPDNIIHGGVQYPVTKIGVSAFYSYRNATDLYLPASLKVIGNRSFSQCYKLSGILNIPNGVTTIEGSAFEYNFFTGLVIPNTVTYIGNSAFASSGNYGVVTIPGSVKTIGPWAFREVRASKIILSPGIENIEMAAFGGTSIKEITIPAGLKKLGSGVFTSCYELEKVIFEAGPSPTVIEADVFIHGQKLKYIDMKDLTTPLTQVVSRKTSSLTSPFRGLNPCTIVYLPSGTPQPASDEENFVIDGVCNNFTAYDNLKGSYNGYHYTLDNWDYRIIYPFTATQASYKNRSFSGETCKTICLPYPSTVPSGMIAYELREKTGSGGYFRFVSITGNQLAANTPYLLRITDSGTHTFGTETNVQVPVTPATIEVAASADGTTFFGGKTENIDNATAAAGGYYNLINNEWRPITTANPNGYVHSFRSYIRSTSPTPAKGFAIVLDDENETTGLGNMEEDIEKGDGKIYSLDGKLLGTDVGALKSGEIYIKNGKKFYKF